MRTTIATGIFAIAVMFTGTVNAEVLGDGIYTAANVDFAMGLSLKKVGMSGKDGIYVVSTGGGKYLSAASSKDGAKVEYRGANKTRWIMHLNSNGWNFMHAENGANALSNTNGKLKLRRNNAGGRGNKDQLWTIKK